MKRKLIAGALVVAGLGAGLGVSSAASAGADEVHEGGITYTLDGGPLPVCVNIIKVTIGGTTIVNVPKFCIPPS